MEASIKDEKSPESISELDGPNRRGDESDSGDSEAEADAEAPATVVSTKRRYPYAPLFFIMAATTGQR